MTSSNWIKIGDYYFIKPPELVTDDLGNVIEVDYRALAMTYKNEKEGHSLFAKGEWPTKNALFPYGGMDHLLDEAESTRIYKNCLDKYGGQSRMNYMVRVDTGDGPNEWQHLDAHPRRARDLGYPENCCWPGSRLNAIEGSDRRANIELVLLNEKGFNLDLSKIPKYPYVNGPPVYARSLRRVNEGDELLTRYGWTKNALTRNIGPEIIIPTGRRKERASSSALDEGPESLLSESTTMVILIINKFVYIAETS